MTKILPSLASANQMCLEQEIRRVESLGYLHFDIEDGNFVPNITFGMKTVRSACEIAKDLCRDAHLMVTNPESYLNDLADCGFSAVAFHWEAAPYPMRLIEKIHSLGMRAGIALNPRTPASSIIEYVDSVDYVLLMSSEPDGAGEAFQNRVLNKIRVIRSADSNLEIIVDGGVNDNNFHDVIQAGASGVVLGRAIFRGENLGKKIADLQQKGRKIV